MAAYNKFNDFIEQVFKGVHNFDSAGHTFNCYLSNELPLAADTVKTDIAEITQQNGYTGPKDIQNSISETSGTATIVAVDLSWTGTGTFGPFQYVVIYNEDATSPLDALVCWYDYGSSISINNGETFTVNFGASLFTAS